MNKIALCLSGQIRTFDKCFPSLKKHILDIVDCDVFAHFCYNNDVSNSNLSVIDFVDIIIEKDIKLDNKEYASRMGPGLTPQYVQQILQQFLSITKCNNIKSRHEEINGFKYDWVIRARTDALFKCDISPISFQGTKKDILQLDNGCVYIPSFACYGGYNDRFAFGNSKNMDTYASLSSHVDDYFDNGRPFHPESLLKSHLDNEITVVNIEFPFDILRENGAFGG